MSAALFPTLEHKFTLFRLYGPRLVNSVVHDVRQRYAGSFLGTLWAVIYPLCLLSFYTLIYVVIFRVKVPNLEPSEYTVFVISGLVPLLMFTEALTTGVSSVMGQRNLLLNTVFPAELLPLRSVLASQVPSFSALMITLFAAIYFGRVSFYWLPIVPMLWILLIMFVSGLVYFLSLLSLVVRDIQQGLGILAMAVMTLSPAAYTPEMVPNAIKFIIYFNPMSYFVQSFQAILALKSAPDPLTLGVAIAISVITFLIGLRFFNRAKHVFVDYA